MIFLSKILDPVPIIQYEMVRAPKIPGTPSNALLARVFASLLKDKLYTHVDITAHEATIEEFVLQAREPLQIGFMAKEKPLEARMQCTNNPTDYLSIFVDSNPYFDVCELLQQYVDDNFQLMGPDKTPELQSASQ